jgi:peptidyl-prolyl cis-trans isomerase SurA
MKKITLVLTMMLLGIALKAQQKELVDKVVAKVGDEYILLSDVEEQFSAAKEQKADLPNEYRCIVLDNILVTKLLLNQAKIDSVLAKDEEVETQLNARFERILDYMGGNTEQFIAFYGQTPEAMKEQMREDMRDQLIVDKMKQKILESVTVTPAEVRAFFDNIPNDSLPYFNQEVEIAEIVYKPKPNDVEKEKSKKFLEELREQITNGKQPFEALAKKYSQDPGSAREGGDLGWAKRGKFVPEFEAQAYRLEEGEMSQVFESEYGFHILQLLKRRGNSVHCRHILIKPEITDNDYAQSRNLMDSIRREILRDSMHFSYAVKQYGDKGTQSYHNDGRLTNPASGNNTFETRDLDPDTYFAIDSMKINSISAPLEVTSPTGEKMYRLVKLLSKSSPHKANLLQDYNKIHAATLEQKKNTKLIEWLEERAKTTFVVIDPMFKNCPSIDKWGKKKDARVKP